MHDENGKNEKPKYSQELLEQVLHEYSGQMEHATTRAVLLAYISAQGGAPDKIRDVLRTFTLCSLFAAWGKGKVSASKLAALTAMCSLVFSGEREVRKDPDSEISPFIEPIKEMLRIFDEIPDSSPEPGTEEHKKQFMEGIGRIFDS